MRLMLLASAIGLMACDLHGSRGPTPAKRADPAAEYVSRVAVERVRVARAETCRGLRNASNCAEVRAELRNAGDRSLQQVSLRLEFAGPGGATIHEERTIAIYAADDYGFRGDGKHLRPGFVRVWTEVFPDLPSAWAGDVTIAVDSVEFSKVDQSSARGSHSGGR